MKQQKELTAFEIRYWNIMNPTKKQYTKAEHFKSQHCTCTAMIEWNKVMKDKYTKKEYTKGKRFNAMAMLEWNKNAAEKFSRKEHEKADWRGTSHMTWWNKGIEKMYTKEKYNKEKYLKEEIDLRWLDIDTSIHYKRIKLQLRCKNDYLAYLKKQKIGL